MYICRLFLAIKGPVCKIRVDIWFAAPFFKEANSTLNMKLAVRRDSIQILHTGPLKEQHAKTCSVERLKEN